MADLLIWLRTRIVPAILTALGVTFLAVGLLSFTDPVAAVPLATPSPSPTATVDATAAPLITLPPLASGGPPSAIPSIPADRVASRIRIAALKVDLPVIAPTNGYPACNVAMYYDDPRLGQPGEGKAVYLYAHARTGMFLPLLTRPRCRTARR